MPKAAGHILFVDDDDDILFTGALLLHQAGHTVVTETRPDEIFHHLQKKSFDLLLLDMNFRSAVHSGNEGLFWLHEVRKKFPEQMVMMVTAYGDVELAVKAIKEGAVDFVTKPWQNEKLLATVNTALAGQKNQSKIMLREQKQMNSPETPGINASFIGNSAAMKKVFETIRKVAPTDANVLILGENGTGKELVAKALHQQSLRKHAVFVSVDMGSLTETLFESELFGHKKGAFTDAREDRAGKFEAAHTGTIFLDEIGNLSLPLQAKLLTVVQNRKVSRVGANQEMQLDVRILSATNAPLDAMAACREFRQDLLYRLNTVSIYLPPLRERKEDIPLLTDHFLQLYNTRYKKAVTIAKEAVRKLADYSWPGNIRELQHLVERAVILCETPEITVNDLVLEKGATPVPPATGNPMQLEQLEKEAIENTLQQHKGNISNAARELGLSRAALYRRIEKYGL